VIKTEITMGDHRIPVFAVNTLVVGCGAAGTSCALHVHDFFSQMGVEDAERRIVVVTHAKGGGASRLSGSDKQTYYKMGTSPRVPDTALDFAKTLTAFGCMHGDIALAEGCGSLRQFYRLVDAGVPFPHDAEGAFLGYKTDHDPYERATSAGPKTSRFMSQCLEARLTRAGVPIHNHLEVVGLLRGEAESGDRIVGVLAMNILEESGPGPGLHLYLANNLVLAAGGPGDIYRTTVYPRRQTGIHGIAFRAGLAAHNMTESQYGLASIKFRWNVSGTYMQVVPRIFSTAADGQSDPREFLTQYFPTMESMATNIFLKGYQWPFDAQRIADPRTT
jgi:succinate dehydrogenase/fumarate reductase flavoprotein subunit